MAYINGTNLILFHDDGENVTAFAGSTSHSLSISNSLREAASKDSGDFLEKEYGRFDWSISTDGLVSYDSDYNFEKLFDLMMAKEELEVIFALNDNGSPDTTKPQYKGKVKIESLDMSAPDADNTTYSVTLQGSGKLSKIAGI